MLTISQANKIPQADQDRARKVLETVPRCMRVIRTEMRSAARSELTVPQFRILAHISIGCGKATQMAENLGVSLVAMSRMVDGLVKRGLVGRAPLEGDRRQVLLGLTPKGERLFEDVRAAVQTSIAGRLKKLSPMKKEKLDLALTLLGEVFL